MIADNVGDNVGDCAGMAADLFETYAVTIVATMVLGALLITYAGMACLETRWCSARSASSPAIIGLASSTACAGQRDRDGRDVQGLGVATAVCWWPVRVDSFGCIPDVGARSRSSGDGICSAPARSGLVVTGAMMWITESTPATARAVRADRAGVDDGHGTNHRGLGVSDAGHRLAR